MTIGELEWEDNALACNELDEARPLVASSRYAPHRFLASRESDLVSLFLADAADAIARFRGLALTTRIHEKLASLFVIADLPWESAILGRRMAVLKGFFIDDTLDVRDALADHTVRRAIDWAAQQNIRFVLCKVYADDPMAIQALQRNGFRLVETVLNYVYDCHEEHSDLSALNNVTIRPAEASDLPRLVEIARAAFKTHVGRFHADPNLSIEEAGRIYEEWIRSSCRGYADAVFVAECDRKIAGFSVWRDPLEREVAVGIRSAHYSIGGVDPAFQKRGLFRALTLAGMRRYRREADLIEGPTNLRNLPVQRAYDRLGWTLRDRQHTFHRWL
jgi:ribosomal protein S18 acetylase RimI-like enzyme